MRILSKSMLTWAISMAMAVTFVLAESSTASGVKYRYARQFPPQLQGFTDPSKFQENLSPEKISNMANPSQFASMFPGGSSGSSGSSSAAESSAASDVKYRYARQFPPQLQGFTDPSKFQENLSPEKISNMANPSQFASMFPGGSSGSSGSSNAAESSAASDVKYRYARQFPPQLQGFTDPSKFQENLSPEKISNMANPSQFASMFPGGSSGSSGSSSAAESSAASDVKYRYARQFPPQLQGFTDPSKFQENLSPEKISNMANPSQFASMFPGGSSGSSGSSSAAESSAASDVKYRYARQFPPQLQGFTDPSKFQENLSPEKISNMANPSQFASMFPGGSSGSSGSSSATESSAASDVKYRYARQFPPQLQGFTDPSKFQENLSPEKISNMANPSQFASMFPGGSSGSSGSSSAAESSAASDVKYRYARQFPPQLQGFTDPSKFQENLSPEKISNMANPSQFASMFPGGSSGSSGSSSAAESSAASDVKYRYARQFPPQLQGFTDPSKFQENLSPEKISNMANPSQFASMFPGGSSGSSGSSSAAESSAASDVKYRYARQFPPQLQGFTDPSKFQENLSPEKISNMANPSQFASMFPGGSSGSSGSSSAAESSAASDVKYRYARQFPPQLQGFTDPSKFQENLSPEKISNMANPSQFASMFPGGSSGSSGSSSAAESSAARK